MFTKTTKNDFIKQFIRVMSFMKNRIWLYAISIINMALLFVVCFQILLPFRLSELFNYTTAGKVQALQGVAFQIALLIFISCIFEPLLSCLVNDCIQKTLAELRLIVFKHIGELPIEYFDKNHRGEIISRLNNDLNTLQEVYFWPLLMILISVFIGISSIVLLLNLNFMIALAVIGIGITSVLINFLFQKPLRVISDRRQKLLGELTGLIVDFVSGFDTIKNFKIGNILCKKYEEKNAQIKNLSVRYSGVNSLLETANYLLANLGFLGVIFLSSYFIYHRGGNIGLIVVCIQLQAGAAFMFNQLGSAVARMQRSLASARQIFNLLDEPVEPLRYDIGSQKTSDHMIDIQEVTFSYDQKKVLENLVLSVSEGKMAALVGPSGSGKSTIIKLLMGFYPLRNGSISIHGKSIGEYQLNELRDMITYVPQDAYLFYGTIEENIKSGKKNASLEDVITAAKAANAHDFIMKLPEKYNTIVGECGTMLSGGQRQRIAIARALIKDSPILLLDEATSAIDSEAEQLIQESLNKLIKGRTAIVIAHRLSTVENADIIYVINGGKVCEQGKHQDLIKNSLLYKELYEMQIA